MTGGRCWCAVCGGTFSMPNVEVGVPDEEDPEILSFGWAYNAEVLSEEQTEWLTDFRVVGHGADFSHLTSELDIVNTSDTPGIFISQPAEWDWRYNYGLPTIPTQAGEITEMSTYGYYPTSDGKPGIMLFPIHQSCLDMIDRICRFRQAQAQPQSSEQPATLAAFCDALQKQRSKSNGTTRSDDGLEWPHNYYGARQFWYQEWEPKLGWEFLCADPSASKIPQLAPYLMGELSKLPRAPTTRAGSGNAADVANHLGWLFPEELSVVSDQHMDAIDIDQAVQGLARTLDKITQEMLDNYERRCVYANEAVLKINRDGDLPALPVGLKNRWRIWKILEQI